MVYIEKKKYMDTNSKSGSEPSLSVHLGVEWKTNGMKIGGLIIIMWSK